MPVLTIGATLNTVVADNYGMRQSLKVSSAESDPMTSQWAVVLDLSPGAFGFSIGLVFA